VHVALAQQPQHEKKWNQRKHEEGGAAAAVNETVNLLRNGFRILVIGLLCLNIGPQIASGTTNATSAKRRHGAFKNKFAARMLVMKSTQLDRTSLHSCATSIVMFGSWKTGPARRNGVPLMWKKRLATSAEADFEAVSRASTKAAARIQARPKKRKRLLPQDNKGTTASGARDDHYPWVLAPRNRTSM
jgi:hypothetical protein